MTLANALQEGLEVAGIGLIIVFSVLIILMIVLSLMKVFFYKPQKSNAPKAAAPVAAPATQAQTQAPAPAVTDDLELVAVLTAAVAACMNTSPTQLRVKSYRRVYDNAPAWNRAGRNDVIDARF